MAGVANAERSHFPARRAETRSGQPVEPDQDGGASVTGGAEPERDSENRSQASSAALFLPFPQVDLCG
jgi:hypothetical protein